MDPHAPSSEPTSLRPRRSFAESAKQVQARLGSAIRRRRHLMGLSLTELSEACGVSFQQVQKYELGVSRISAAQLWKIATPLGVHVTYFYEGLSAADAR